MTFEINGIYALWKTMEYLLTIVIILIDLLEPHQGPAG